MKIVMLLVAAACAVLARADRVAPVDARLIEHPALFAPGAGIMTPFDFDGEAMHHHHYHNRHHRGGRRGPPRRRRFDDDDDDEDDDESGKPASLKDRCEAIAHAKSWRDIDKHFDRHATVSYDNDELPFSGRYHGPAGLALFRERLGNTLSIDKAHSSSRVVSFDDSTQVCVLKSNLTGTFARSGASFTDVRMYTMLTWALGRVVKMELVDGSTHAEMMQAYYTPAQKNAHKLAEAIHKHGPGAEVDKLVAADCVATLGRDRTEFKGAGAVSSMLKEVAARVEAFGIEREELALPYHAGRSKRTRLLFADEHSVAGVTSKYNIKSSTTSFARLSTFFFLRFNMEGKLQSIRIAEARAFLPGELASKAASDLAEL